MTKKRIPELDDAAIIIACGAGVRTEEDFALVRDLADYDRAFGLDGEVA